MSSTGAEPAAYTYDNPGNITSDGARDFFYNRNNRLVRVETGWTVIAEYAYDGFERRVKKVAGGVTTHYHYDLNGRLIAETDGAGNPIRDYVYLDGEPVAMQVYGAGWYWFLNDHLGTPQKLVDSAGAVVWQAAYMPFGEARILTDAVENNLRFPGQYYDAETGLHYNWHRYYDPGIGRYLRADPIGLVGGINLFAYVQNNPINFTDRYGLFVDDTISPAIAAAIGAGMIATYEGSKRALKWLVNNWNESTENNESDACPESTPIKPPFKGEPGSTVQGKKQSRQYGDDGKPLIDRDLPHPGGPKKEREDHSHDWGPDGRGPARDPQPGDPPQPIGF